jgi:hypothetical protein
MNPRDFPTQTDIRTLPPGPGDELTDRERLKLIEGEQKNFRKEVNQALGNLHALLSEIRDDLKALGANVKVVRDQGRRHSTRITQLEIQAEQENKNGHG